MPINTYTQSFFRLADGSELAAYFDIPQVGDGCHPLAVILGGGYGDATAASSAFRNNAGELLDRGWAVTAPVSPKGESFGGDNISFVRQLIDLLKGRGDIRDSSVLLLGISRGAVAALEMVVREQELYRGLIAAPAVVSGPLPTGSLEKLPVYLRVGRDDPQGWGEQFQETVRQLKLADADLDAALLDNVGHTVTLDWESLDNWLASIMMTD